MENGDFDNKSGVFFETQCTKTIPLRPQHKSTSHLKWPLEQQTLQERTIRLFESVARALNLPERRPLQMSETNYRGQQEGTLLCSGGSHEECRTHAC